MVTFCCILQVDVGGDGTFDTNSRGPVCFASMWGWTGDVLSSLFIRERERRAILVGQVERENICQCEILHRKRVHLDASPLGFSLA